MIMLEKWWSRYALFRLGLDIVLTELSLLFAWLIRPWLPFGLPLALQRDHRVLLLYGVVAIIWTAAFLLLSIYEAREQRAVEEAQAVFVATTLATLTLAALLYFTFRDVSRLMILTFYVCDVATLIGARLIMARVLREAGLPRYGRRRILILGAGEGGRDVCRMIDSRRWAGLEPVGFLDDVLTPGAVVEGRPVLGRVDQVAHYVDALQIDEVVIALPLHAYDRFFRVLDALVALPARVRIVPDHIKNTLFRTRVSDFAGVPMIMLQRPSLAPFERAIKRAFDLAIGATSLILSMPLLVVVAIAIGLDSPGPVLFRQQRVGENGKLFWMFKFRSMVKDAEKQQADMLRYTDDGLPYDKHPDDPRVTRVGRFIRRTSLDELPQLLNVLKGDMSIVGPRPEMPVWVEQYEPWQWLRFLVPQGITGWWQVNGRSDRPMHLHTEDDLYYIQNYSLLLDVQILWRTAAAVFKRQGAF
jgi:exopolysaccharide biosynthesis polyprenyl glycosylphosphotransferase